MSHISITRCTIALSLLSIILLDGPLPIYGFAPNIMNLAEGTKMTTLSLSPSDDDEFMNDLESAKQKLGTPMSSIPITDKDFIKESEDSKNDFLAAMKVVSEEFKVQKEQLGVDGAIDLSKSQWDLEDKLKYAKDEDIVGEFE
mmetsp:Transcript_5703/g.8644  ORF Transcript_5703/g.8644 Transcript_5703/m.8644 type:complete len:143 (+) Transcript_5703:280-708(+)